MFSSFVAYLVIGLPLGYYLGFGRRGLGAAGLWTGLAFSLAVIGTALVFAWKRKVQRLEIGDTETVVAMGSF